MKVIERLKAYRRVVVNERKMIQIIEASEYQNEFYSAELIRYTHSIEKGLSIEKPRIGYGHKKLNLMMTLIEKLEDSKAMYHQEAVQMALDAIRHYVEFHEKNSFTDDTIEILKKFTSSRSSDHSENYGGVIEFKKNSVNFDVGLIEKLFNTRHSIRDFEDYPIDESVLLTALELAQRAPSACNRQGYRVHVLSHDKSNEYAKELDGIGGFEKNVGRFILITGKVSAYRIDEPNQYIVSASMFAAYLTLTLHLYGMGACVIQRPLLWNSEWVSIQSQYGIPLDEQLVCLLAVGNIKNNSYVPRSHRLNSKTMFDFIN